MSVYRFVLRGWASRRMDEALGGPDRLRPVALLAAVLALNTADTGTIGAAAAQLEADLRISHAQLGLLATASSGVGALASIPMGVLADRVVRVRLLTLTIAAWAVAMVLGGLAQGYWWLLLSRLALGAAIAAAGPVVSSLVGDLFPPGDRARVLGVILTGEIAGAGAGLLIGGEISAVSSWRYAFLLLAAASAALAVAVGRLLAEPARDGAAWGRGPSDRSRQAPEGPPGDTDDAAHAAVAAKGVGPDPERLLATDPIALPFRSAAAYLLSIPTNRLLIIGSSIGYFFFAGLRSFVVIFALQHFHIPQTRLGALIPIIGIGGLAGAVLGGRVTDAALHRGHVTARVVVPAIGYAGAAVFFLPAMATTSLALSLPLVTIGAAALSAANPPLDAARLDIVPGRMWGRAESLRTVLRLAAEAIAPASFGLLADWLGHGIGRSNAAGLRDTLLLMLLPLFANGLIMLAARPTYPVDIATAVAVDQRRQRKRPR